MYQSVTVHCDGGSRGNPGPAAIGYVIRDADGLVLEEQGKFIGHTTNNQAEYKAVIYALEAAAQFTHNSVCIVMDSQLVVRQLNGEYRVKSADLWPLYQEVKEQEAVFEKVMYTATSRETPEQQVADQQVNLALDAALQENGETNANTGAA